MWDATEQKRLRRTFDNPAEAKNWHRDAVIALRRGHQVTGKSNATLKAVSEDFLALAASGAILNRSGDAYKPSAVRSYRQTLTRHVWPSLGDEPIRDVSRADLQQLVDDAVAAGVPAASVTTFITPLRAIFKREISRDRLTVNPTADLQMPAVRGGRDRIADPTEGAQLLAALSDADRPIWSTAMYAGLRRGEIRALRHGCIDLAAGVIRVECGWDDIEGEIPTKNRGNRKVPIPDDLRGHLATVEGPAGALAFGDRPNESFDPKKLTARADDAWKAAGLTRITLHECRHTYASLMIAAGVNAKTLSTYMGHANITITLDKYGHLFPGNEDEAAGLLNAYLKRSIRPLPRTRDAHSGRSRIRSGTPV
ncbi:MAG TPA: site-specific integrase [Thermoleophilaceae bacterium]|nr:site-specific integrase [Thermoleophilaceae bacterium]